MSSKLRNDFGVRALLAVMVVALLAVICVMLLVFMYMKDVLTVETALTILAATQIPGMAMAAIAFYFGTKASQGGSTTTTTTASSTSPATPASSNGLDLSSIVSIIESAITKAMGTSATPAPAPTAQPDPTPPVNTTSPKS